MNLTKFFDLIPAVTLTHILWWKVGICNIRGSLTHFSPMPNRSNCKIHKLGLRWTILSDCPSFINIMTQIRFIYMQTS